MRHECGDCGATFETLSKLRLHDCSGDDTAGSPQAGPVELDAPVDAASDGDVSALHRAVATYDAELRAALERDDGGETYRDLFWGYYEPLANGLDAAAREGGWDVLAEFVDAYDPAADEEGVPPASPVVENGVGRFVIRTRLRDGVAAIPVPALGYLRSIPRHTDADVPREESFAFGWGVGHPDHDVAGEIVDAAATDFTWVSGTLERAFYADQSAAADLLERLVTDDAIAFTVPHPQGDVDSARFFLDTVAGPEFEQSMRLPRYWDWQAEFDYTFEWDRSVEQRIRTLVEETGVAESLPSDWTFEDLAL